VQPLPPKLPPKPKHLLAGSATSLAPSEDGAQDTTFKNKTAALKKLLVAALDLIDPKRQQVNGKPPLERKATFDIPMDDEKSKDSISKKPRLAATPGPARGANAAARVSTPAPASTRVPYNSPAPVKRTSLRAVASTPMPTMIPGRSNFNF
jgi:hypothetical protein